MMNNAVNNISPLAFFDPPQIIDCSFNPIPGSGSLPLQVIASTPTPIVGAHFITSSNEYIGLYSGPQGSEKLVCIMGGPTPQFVRAVIPKGTRVSLRNMSANAISTGSICGQFFGFV